MNDNDPATVQRRARQERIRALRRRVLAASARSLLLPGAGHLWLPGQRIAGVVMIAATLLGVATAITHLTIGLSIFENPRGSFLFGVLLRGLIVLYTAGIVDSYLTALDPEDREGIERRRAVTLNLLLPASGYIAARAWLRAATGALVLALIVAFSGLRYHRYLDLVYIGMQLVMAAAVYQHLRARQLRAVGDAPFVPRPPPLDPVAAAQIVAFVVTVAAVLALGWIVQLRMPSYAFAEVGQNDVHMRPSPAGITVRVPPLQLMVTTWGDGWIAESNPDGLLFAARHERNATLRLGTELILPFVKPHRYVERLRRRMVEGGYRHEKTKRLDLNGTPGYQLWFSRRLGSQTIDQWTIAVPREHFAFLMLIECNRVLCQKIQPALEKTRDSFKLGLGAVLP